MTRNRDCKALQHSDQMICSPCGYVWDVSDTEPPECRCNCSSSTQPRVVVTTGRQEIKPCPFCGSAKLTPVADKLGAFVACDQCGAMGPTKKLGWNDRVVA